MRSTRRRNIATSRIRSSASRLLAASWMPASARARRRAPDANSALHSDSSGAISGSTSQALLILARARGEVSGRPRAASTAAAVRRAARWAVA